MPNPKRKHTRSRRDSRRSANWRLDAPTLSRCSNPKCGAVHPPHTICSDCGFYNGKLVQAPKVKRKKGEQGSSEGGAQA